MENCQRRVNATLEIKDFAYRKPFIPCPAQGFSKSFLDRANWRKYIDKKHRTTLVCNVDSCLSTFTFNDDLRAHRLQAHNTVQGYGCAVCDKFFGNQGLLNRHRGTRHSKINPSQCPYQNCSNGYSYSSGMRAHIVQDHLNAERTLLGFFKLTDSRCRNAIAFRKDHLNSHLITVHGIEPAHDYECDRQDCMQDFISNRALRIHQRLDHPKIPCGCCCSCYIYVDKLEAHATKAHGNVSILALLKWTFNNFTTFTQSGSRSRKSASSLKAMHIRVLEEMQDANSLPDDIKALILKVLENAKTRRPKEKQAPDSTLFHYAEHCHQFY